MLNLLVLALLISLSVSAAVKHTPNHFCSVLLAAAGKDGGFPVETVVDTYKTLLKDLGDGKITPDVISAMVAAKDPFTLPKNAHMKSATLQDALDQLKTLLGESEEKREALKAPLLAALEKMRTGQANQDKKQETDSKKAATPRVRDYVWTDAAQEITMWGDWMVTVGGYDFTNSKERHTVELKNRDGKNFTVEYDEKYEVIVNELNLQTGELWFSDRNRPIKIYKMVLFDSSGVPLKKAVVSEVELGEKAKQDYSCDGLAFSPTGSQFLVVDSRKGGLLLDPQKGGAELGKVVTGGTEPHYGFIGDHHVYVHKGKSSILVADVRDPKEQVKVNVPDRYTGVTMSPDGKRLYVSNDTQGEKPHVVVFDMDVLKKNPNDKGKKWDLGHSKPVASWQGPFRDEVFPLNGDKVIQLLRDDSLNSRAIEFRLVDVADPAKPKILQTLPMPKVKETPHDLKITKDGRYIYAKEEMEKNRQKTWVWDIKELFGE